MSDNCKACGHERHGVEPCEWFDPRTLPSMCAVTCGCEKDEPIPWGSAAERAQSVAESVLGRAKREIADLVQVQLDAQRAEIRRIVELHIGETQGDGVDACSAILEKIDRLR